MPFVHKRKRKEKRKQLKKSNRSLKVKAQGNNIKCENVPENTSNGKGVETQTKCQRIPVSANEIEALRTDIKELRTIVKKLEEKLNLLDVQKSKCTTNIPETKLILQNVSHFPTGIPQTSLGVPPSPSPMEIPPPPPPLGIPPPPPPIKIFNKQTIKAPVKLKPVVKAEVKLPQKRKATGMSGITKQDLVSVKLKKVGINYTAKQSDLINNNNPGITLGDITSVKLRPAAFALRNENMVVSPLRVVPSQLHMNLRKTGVIRSPGGTPMVKRDNLETTGSGLTPHMTRALLRKFKSVHRSPVSDDENRSPLRA